MAQTVQTVATTTYLSVPLPLDSLPKQLTYNVDGNIQTIAVQYPVGAGAVTYTKTFTWAGGLMTAESQWMPPA